MRRALGEYAVAGIKTTVPFFAWLFTQPEFLAASVHTTYLDEVLKARNGRPFVEPAPDVEDVAAIAAALQSVLSPATVGAAPAAASSYWKSQARAGGLR
jgi:acetyl/propionyl-CoA carboxylase alpha subunit